MTRKHFVDLAKSLKDQRPGENWDANKKVQWDLDVKAVASVCERAHPAFSYERFYKACGGLFNA